MPSISIPFPLSSTPGASPQESAGRLINCYAEPLGKVVQGDLPAPQVVWRRSAGLSRFATSVNSGFRGHLLVDNILYAAWSGKASRFGSTGTETTMTGALSGTERVFWARNNKTTADVVCCAPQTGLFQVTTTNVTSLSSWGSPNSICFMDSYLFATYGDGTIQASDQNDITLNSLNRTKAQSKPGGLYRSVPFNGQLFAFGPTFGEVYSNTANPVGFPLSRSYVLQRGLLGRYAVAGHEDNFGMALIWVADDKSVVMANGSPNPLKISPPDLDRIIQGVTDFDTLDASVYIEGGHPKWVLSGPNFTWEFDLGSQKWNERKSYQLNRWRVIGGQFAFGKWIVGDTKSSKLLYVDGKSYTEDADPLIFHLESGSVNKFPSRTRVARADFNFITGVGIATGTDPIATVPRALVSWSQNLGVTWGTEFERELGRQAQPEARITMLRTGMTGTQGRRWRLRVSDPVYVAFLGGAQDTELRSR